MRAETQVKLNQFKVRPYQCNFGYAFEKEAYRKYLIVWPRRAGKDYTIFNLILRAAIRHPGGYAYCLPTHRQSRLVIWESMTNDGRKFIDCIPEELIKRKSNQEMVIELTNGSVIRLMGSDNFDTNLIGTNMRVIVFSEFALADSRAYKLALPIINANKGQIVVISTPRGHNHFYDLFQIAKNNPKEWYCEKLTIEDTQHIPLEYIKRDVERGEMSEELAKQEYWTDFSLGIAGTYYGVYMDKMRNEERITEVPYEPDFEVHCAFDLGVNNPTAIVFFQVIGSVIHIIDYYQNNSEGLEHYASVLKAKPYTYGKLFVPHDIKVKEFGTGMTRMDKARQLGLEFIVTPMMSIEDGIEAVRSVLPRCWIDNKRCGKLIKALENYRREYDEKRNVYYEKPVHDMYSDACDAARYMALNIKRCGKESSPEELEKRYRQVMYGEGEQVPRFFRDDL